MNENRSSSRMFATSQTEQPTRLAHLNGRPVEYRLEQRGGPTVVVLHGGHMRAGMALGEDVFTDAGYSVLAPSRPGYGRTPLTTGTSASGFADVTAALCEHLGIAKAAAVVGISAAGPTAVAMAARHPELVERLILQSAVGPLAWPELRTRMAAHVAFGVTEKASWGAVRALLRAAPDAGLRMLLGGLSTKPPREVVAALGAEDRASLIALFTAMRSGRGFLNDLNPAPDTTGDVSQPTLVIATRNDGSVPFAHARALSDAIAHATLLESRADSHFVWLGPDWPTIAGAIRECLALERQAT